MMAAMKECVCVCVCAESALREGTGGTLRYVDVTMWEAMC